MMKEDFVPTTYEEWLEHHRLYGYPQIVKLILKNCSHLMVYGQTKKEKEE